MALGWHGAGRAAAKLPCRVAQPGWFFEEKNPTQNSLFMNLFFVLKQLFITKYLPM